MSTKTETTKATAHVLVRAMRKVDLRQIVLIEQAVYSNPRSRRDFCRLGAHPRRFCLVAAVAPSEAEKYRAVYWPERVRRLPVAGFLIYREGRRSLAIEDVVVDEDWRRRGIARALVEAVPFDGPCNPLALPVRALVSERDLDTHLFFRAVGFRAISILRGFYADGDGYLFVRSPAIGQPTSMQGASQ